MTRIFAFLRRRRIAALHERRARLDTAIRIAVISGKPRAHLQRDLQAATLELLRIGG